MEDKFKIAMVEEGKVSAESFTIFELAALSAKTGVEYDPAKVRFIRYLNLKDFYGREIYQDYVVQEFVGTELVGTVGRVSSSPSSGVTVGGLPLWYRNCVVLGNVYENPELLLGK